MIQDTFWIPVRFVIPLLLLWSGEVGREDGMNLFFPHFGTDLLRLFLLLLVLIVVELLDQDIEIVIIEVDRRYLHIRRWRNQFGIIQMLPSDNRPFLGILVGNLFEGCGHKLEIIDLDSSAIEVGKLFPVGKLRLSPEKFDTVQVWSVRRIEYQWDFVGLKPIFHIFVVVNAGVIHEDSPFVS